MSLARALRLAVRGTVREREPLAPLSSLRAGGAADVLFLPADAEDLAAGLRLLAAEGRTARVLGGGANTLVSDGGVHDPVVQLGPGFSREDWPAPREVVLGAALSGMRAVRAAHRRGLVGPEFLAGIPGTLGGQVKMNAGTARTVGDILVAAELVTVDGAGWFPAAELGLGYRESRLPAGAVVTAVRLSLSEGDVEAADREILADIERRRTAQPWDRPTLGSTFKNPPGDAAGRLLEAAGVKGLRRGAMAFSEKHANFLVNEGGGKAADAFALVETARRRVLEASGVALALEIALLGDFS